MNKCYYCGCNLINEKCVNYCEVRAQSQPRLTVHEQARFNQIELLLREIRDLLKNKPV